MSSNDEGNVVNKRLSRLEAAVEFAQDSSRENRLDIRFVIRMGLYVALLLFGANTCSHMRLERRIENLHERGMDTLRSAIENRHAKDSPE